MKMVGMCKKLEKADKRELTASEKMYVAINEN